MQSAVTAELIVAGTAAEAAAQADIICTTTSARTPVLHGAWIRPGTHINAIGSSTPEARELDMAAVTMARIFVDSIEAAQVEAGDLLAAAGPHRPDGAGWTELGTVLNGRSPGRESAAQVTLFKSVGLAVEDAAAASVIMRNLAGASR
jgi:ornithine cyclodeaminase/alanine dehydrogenase-like protein (mu-crystallin family)